MRHIPHYAVLLTIFLLVFLSRLFLAFDERLMLTTLFLVAFLYVAWGILHHLLEHDLGVKIVIEYILIGSLFMLLSIIVLRGGL